MCETPNTWAVAPSSAGSTGGGAALLRSAHVSEQRRVARVATLGLYSSAGGRNFQTFFGIKTRKHSGSAKNILTKTLIYYDILRFRKNKKLLSLTPTYILILDLFLRLTTWEPSQLGFVHLTW